MKPQIVMTDSHPNYFSTRLAQEFAENNELPIHFIQHHKAHIYSVMAENDLENVLGFHLTGPAMEMMEIFGVANFLFAI